MAEVAMEPGTADVVADAMSAISGTSSQPAEPTDGVSKAVVTNPVTLKKQNPARKIATKFFGGDPKDVALYLVNDVLLPAVKSTFVTMFEEGLERLVFGDTMADRQRRRITGVRGNGIAYDKVSAQRQGGRIISRKARITHDFDQLVYQTRQEAESVLSHLYDYLERYGVVRVSDLYDLSDATSNFTDRGWGWTDLRGSRIVAIREGYIIELPDPVEVRG